jgi:hypothetical protein
VVRETHALPSVPALVEPPALSAPRLIHVKHLPIVQPAVVALHRKRERGTHAVPYSVDRVDRHRTARHGGRAAWKFGSKGRVTKFIVLTKLNCVQWA